AVTFGYAPSPPPGVPDPTGASISPDGVYVVPNIIGLSGVIATSVADPLVSAAAAVTAWPAGVAPTPTGTMASPHGFATAPRLANGRVLIAGGDVEVHTTNAAVSDTPMVGGISQLDLYDPSTGSFSPAGPLGTPRYAHTATLLPNGKVLLVGGIGPALPD